MKAKLTSLLLLLLLFPMVSALAAPLTVSGTVTDPAGNPLRGVSVIVKGTTTVATTNIDGEFTIKASEGQEIRFSYVGSATTELTVNGPTMNVILPEEVNTIGIKSEQKALTSNAQSVSGMVLTKKALYVVDGVPTSDVNTDSSSIGGIRLSDIESVTVLDGPAAAALYGPDAAGGAIVVTTKKGAAGR